MDEFFAALGQDLLRALVGSVHQAVDLLVDLARHFFAVVALFAKIATQEDQLFLMAEGQGAQLLRHPPLGHHPARQLGRLADIVRGAGRDVAEDELFCHPAAENDGHIVVQLAP